MATTEDAKFIKCVVVGDGAVGKTCLLMSYANNKFPTEYVPTVFDNYSVSLTVRDQIYVLGLFDTAGQEEYQSLRSLSYAGTHAFIVCFSTVMPESMRNAEQKWVPEIRHQMPKTPFILVGTQKDLRQDERILQRLQKRKMKPVTTEYGERLAKRLNADRYAECSALTREGLKNVFDEVMLSVLQPSKKTKEKKATTKCVIL